MNITTVQTLRAEGAQFLDGIGETALIARYPLDGNLDDWSRNSLHASMEKGKPRFVDDELFGKALALSASVDGGFIKLPGQLLDNEHSISFAGWFKFDDLERVQVLFELGRSDTHRFRATVAGNDAGQGISVILFDGQRKIELEQPSFEVRTGDWMHIAVVLDRSKQSLLLYVGGERIATEGGVEISLRNVLNSAQPKGSHILLGGSINDGASFSGSLSDVRFYRIALSDRQVEVIRHNAISDDKWDTDNIAAGSVEAYRIDGARQLIPGLTAVEPIEIETSVGHLPELPYFLPGIYKDCDEGPMVRVIWPAPRDNAMVRETGSYVVTGRVPGTEIEPVATVKVTAAKRQSPPAEHVLRAFPLGQVWLGRYPDGSPTPFVDHRDKFFEALAKSNPDDFLYTFRDAFGQPQPEGAEELGVWDAQTCRLRGHGSGHYLTAIAQAYDSTSYDPELNAHFKQKMDYLVEVLYELSEMSGTPTTTGGPHVAEPTKVPTGPGRGVFDSDLSKDGIRTDAWNWGKGFISAYPPDQFIMLEHGASYGTGNDQVWAPYYTLHKILQGLMDIHEMGDNPKALKVAEGMGLWVYKRLNELPEESLIRMWNSYIAGEYGGMNESMARLFRITGDSRFLECAKLFDNVEFFFGDANRSGGLARNVDTIRGKHSNQHVPQITGALKTYRETGDPDYYEVVDNFWHKSLHSYTYSIGGVAGARNPNNAECYAADPDALFRHGFSEGGQNETCATYNLLKLGRGMFMFDADSDLMDYYERALYNQILASVAEHNAGNTYHVPLNPGAIKTFSNAEMDGFTCCNGTAIESGTKLQNTIYFASTDNSELYVNLYVPSTLDWQAQGVRITQETHYPYSERSKFSIDGSGEFTLNLRIPGWAKHGVSLWINGEAQSAGPKPGSYLSLARNWKDGDTVEIELVMDFHLMPVMDQPNVASIFYGPVLLAAQEEGPLTDWRKIRLDPEYIGRSFSGDPKKLRFEADGIEFRPFFETYGHHSVYLDIVTPDGEAGYPPISMIHPPEDGFFAKQLDFHGIPIKSSAAVDDRALREAYDRLAMMLRRLPEIRKKLVEEGAELHIIGRDEVTTDLPDHRHLKGKKISGFSGLSYDERTRGLGGLRASCGEENLLRLPEDRYRGRDICVHEFSHTVLSYGADPEVVERFEAQRKRSLSKGLWVDAYASVNKDEFFAELAMWYFGGRGDIRMKGTPPADGPEGLNAYDPEAYQLVDAFWSGHLSS